MAQKGNIQPSDRSRVRFMLVDVDGTSSDVQQLAQILAGAVRAPQTSVMQSPPVLSIPTTSLANTKDAPTVGDPDAAVFEPNEDQAPVAIRSQSGAKKKLRTPKLVPGLEFTSGEKTLKQYWDEQGDLKEESKRYLVVTQWLKRYRGIEEVGADHIYSAYRSLGLHVPNDVLSVFRALKKQAWVEKGSKQGRFQMTHVGEKQLKATE